MSKVSKYHSPAHYAAFLRDRAVIEETAHPGEGYNGVAAMLSASADMLDIQAGKIKAKDVLIEHFKACVKKLAGCL